MIESSSDIDIEKCSKIVGGHFNLVLMAIASARRLRNPGFSEKSSEGPSRLYVKALKTISDDDFNYDREKNDLISYLNGATSSVASDLDQEEFGSAFDGLDQNNLDAFADLSHSTDIFDETEKTDSKPSGKKKAIKAGSKTKSE